MSLDRCIPALVHEGKLTPEQGKKAKAVYGDLVSHYERTMGRPAAEALASEDAVAALQRDAAIQKQQAMQQIAVQKRILVDMAAYDGGSGKHPGAAALALFDHDNRAPYMNVEAQRKAILGRAHDIVSDILFKHSKDILGRIRGKAGLDDLVRAAFGEKVESDSARQLADAWGQAAEMLRLRFNQAGGAIDKLHDWGLPQSHDSDKVRAAGNADPRMAALQSRYAEASGVERPALERQMNQVAFENWRDAILPRLDPSRMIDRYTGKPFAPKALDAALHDVFDTIRSDGLNKLNPGGVASQGKLANRRSDPRFLMFKSADDWMAYADRFGSRDAYDVMMGHISGMARDIAHMEVLGPNPAATVRWLHDGLNKAAAIDGSPDGTGRAKALYASFRLGQMYQATSGALSSPVNPKVAYFFGSVRSLMTASKLGASMLSATTDIGFQAVTRAFNGLPIAGAVGDYVKLLNPANGADRRVAVRLGLIAQEASHVSSAQQRYLGEAVTGELAARLAEGVLRASGVSAWTQAGRWAFGMEMLGHLADQVEKPFEQLDGSVARSLQRYGIGPTEWETLRATPLYEHEGATFLRPQDVDNGELGDRLLRMVHSETAYAVPEATVRARSFWTFGPPGSLAGEFSRNAGLFKSFGVSMLMTHGARVMQQQGWNKAAYAAGLIVTTTVMGALAMQLKQIVKGADAQPMTGLTPMQAATFWTQAMIQGGGFGIMGDFLATATSDRASGSGSLGDAVAGPVAGLFADAGALTIGSLAKAVQGKDPHLGRNAVKFAKSYTPGSTLWYARLAMDRLIWDQIQMQADPQYPESFGRMHQRAQEQGQDYWWAPGEPLPARAPAVNSTPQ